MDFNEKWLETIDKKGSILCAGLDPAEFKMGRGDEGLQESDNKFHWSLRYIESVAPYCAAIKPNFQYWKGELDSVQLREVVKYAKDLELIVIDDSKLADIGSTNDAGMFFSKDLGADAVTIAPYAGNMREAADLAREHGIGAITMCLMSNPEFQREKNMLVRLNSKEEEKSYRSNDLINYGGSSLNVFVHRYISLAHDAQNFGLSGIVIGAPSFKNHIKNEEIEKIREYVDDEKLVLLPGIGEQGGEAESIWKHFGINNVIVNVGRSLMFPNGSNSSSEDHKEAAKHYKNMLNESRNEMHSKRFLMQD